MKASPVIFLSIRSTPDRRTTTVEKYRRYFFPGIMLELRHGKRSSRCYARKNTGRICWIKCLFMFSTCFSKKFDYLFLIKPNCVTDEVCILILVSAPGTSFLLNLRYVAQHISLAFHNHWQCFVRYNTQMSNYRKNLGGHGHCNAQNIIEFMKNSPILPIFSISQI